ncbi:polymeric immunoglobulin receptor-like isoform X2 [Hoplias malabaricus]|uniref:polymeric immunoglobulin receptor-like isoform X2 n=1 Tax=Hoplias malabaricus TaxID=27720 RepID=UPI003462DC10
MKILLIFSLYLILAAGGSTVRGFSGGGVLIKCRYETQYTSNTKYFCKGSGLTCVDQIRTDVKNEWVNSGRVSLFDDTSAAVFWVMIRDLTVEDSGLYQCAVDKTLLLDSYTPVELKVEEGPHYGNKIIVISCEDGDVDTICKYSQSIGSRGVQSLPGIIGRKAGIHPGGDASPSQGSDNNISVKNVSDCNSSIHVTGRAGGSVNISCKYPDLFRNYTRFLFRREGNDERVYKTPVNESGKWINQGKYSLHDDRVKNTLSVIISDVNEGDSGEYWCGAESDWECDNGYKLYITHINLTVTAEKVAPATTSSSTSSSSETQPEELNTTSTLTSTGPSLSDASKASTTNPVVFVFVVLLMSGFIFFIVALWKRHTTQAPASAPTQSQTNSSENHRDSDAEADYEDIHEPRQLPATDCGLFTVYTTAKFPTDPVTVYSYVHLPTKTCNPTKPINSNEELPIGLSDSAESPIYATVDLSKKADGFAVSTATINKQRN